MARPRQFDEAQAVEAAMRAFWSTGYEATSTQDLCEATGLGRSSIYNTFTSKHDLFRKALVHYMDERTASIIEVLDGQAPVREKVRDLLWRSVGLAPDDPHGCLVVNTMVELAPRDPEIAELLGRDLDRRRTALRDAFETARLAGEIAADQDPNALAAFVIGVISGMRVAERGGADRVTLESIATTALRAI
ncbi:TetR/AcrR family transcriptional regulator [Nonomuraea longicatena]